MRVRASLTALIAVLFATACADNRNREITIPTPVNTPAASSPVIAAQPTAQSASTPSPTTPPVQTIEIADEPFNARTGPGFRSALGTPRDAYGAGEYGKDVWKTAADPVWIAYFNSHQIRDRNFEVRLVAGGAAYNSQCLPLGQQVTLRSPRGFYCSKDGIQSVLGFMYLPTATYFAIWETLSDQANFVGAVVAANLYTYHVAQILQAQLRLPVLTESQARLVTICYTGIWLRVSYPAGEQKPADMDAALAAIQKGVGLNLEAGELELTLDEMRTAFDLGRTEGQVGKCGAYWPGTLWATK